MTIKRLIQTDSPEAFIEEIEKIQGALPKRIDGSTLLTINPERSRRIDANPKNVEKGLAKLVLTLIELIRKLLEKQAMRRIDAGSLTEEEIERIGETLMKLENKMQELKGVFGLKDEELNINLGPLGDLM